MAFHCFVDPDGNGYGSFETLFFCDCPDLDDDGNPLFSDGWYWQACFPGCLPDGEAVGPFESEEAAIQDANDT